MINIELVNQTLSKVTNTMVNGAYWKEGSDFKETLQSLNYLKKHIEDSELSNGLDDVKGHSDSPDDFWEYITNPDTQAETTHIPELDRILKWKRGWHYAFTGYSNEGKSAFLYFLLTLKVVLDDAKIAVFSPENFPRNRFIKDVVKTILGRDPKYCEKEQVLEIYNRVIKNVFYVYPDTHTIEEVEKEFRTLIRVNGVTYCVVDPFLKLTGQSGNDIAGTMKDYVRGRENFSKAMNVSYITIYHQLTPQIDESTKNYPEPDMYRMKGGGNIADGSDFVLAVWRNLKKTDPSNGKLRIITQKVKEHDIAELGYLNMEYNLSSNRYLVDGIDIFELLTTKVPF
jgi:hypothetical protein